jgi:chromosome partitioning protein
MDGNEKRRSRRLFSRRRQEEDEEPVTAAPDPAPDDTAVTGGSVTPVAAPPEAAPPGAAAPAADTVPGAGGSGDPRAAAPATEPALGGSVQPTSVTEMLAQAAAAPAVTDAASESATAPARVPSPADPAPRPAASDSPAAPADPEAQADAGDGDAHEAGAVEEDDEDLTYELPRIIAVANQKGGVGKTTTSVNLGAALAELGYRVLVVDLDPQGNASTGLGINARNLTASIYDVIMNDAPIEDCVEPTSLKNLFLAPATIDLAGAEIELVPAFSRELKLRRALESVRDDYDYMIIDCPPSLGLLTVNGLAAADDVIVPIQCEYYALEGLSQLVRNVTLVQTNLNPKLDVRGIVLTMYDARTKLADQVEQEVRNHFGRRVYQTVVPRTVRLSEAPSFGQPIILFDPTSRGAVAYRELAKEVSSGATRRTG